MITLKEITLDDLEFARKLRNKFKNCFFNQKEIDEETHLDWFNKIQTNNRFRFFIIWLDKERIGTISLTDLEKDSEIGNVIIDKKYQGKGYLRQAIDKLLEKFKNDYRQTFFVKVIPSNQNAILAYQALGFKEKKRTLWI